MEQIAVLDDDPDFLEFVSTLLEGAGYKAAMFPTAGKLLDALLRRRFDLMVVDVRLPGLDGREFVRILRKNEATKAVPVIVVSGLQMEPSDVVRGLEEGADEYLLKPLETQLFLLRVRSLLDRAANGHEPLGETLEIGPLVMRPAERVALLKGAPMTLTRLEYDVLEYFIRHPGRVLTRGILLQEIWKDPTDVATRTVDKHIETVRRKLGEFGARIETVVGLGYAFRPQAGVGSRHG